MKNTQSKYYNHYREDILIHVSSETKYVLSVGCGSGATEAELIKRGMKVTGIEFDHGAAEIARQRGVFVLEGDAAKVDLSYIVEPFDCLVYADVLEHLSDPVLVLKNHVKNLKSGGSVIISVPNFRNYSVLWQLFVQGHIKYVDAGILDRTHIKMTTRKMVLEWFETVGIKPVFCDYIIARKRDKLISTCLLDLAKEFLSYQIICVGQKK